mmetsp:Transcript_38756/g.77184  ORF Transcript_38756/g.77184 Transcript_38756/m.77184 type:complete len:293 (+) Transcript_38756:110-988(+)
MAPALDTVIYLDIDGVLNVGIRDHGNAPLLLNEDNCTMALRFGDTSRLRQRERECIEKVISVVKRSFPGDTEAGTYRKYACTGKHQCSDILLHRVKQIIKAAGDGAHVVLASNWRKPKYVNKVMLLEKEISKHLGRTFTFDSTTEVINENGAPDRLHCIGKHVREISSSTSHNGALRLLVLDDFFVTPFNGWACEHCKITSSGDVEAYLKECAQCADVSVKMVHCYEDWLTNEGYRVEVGTGLTAQHTAIALDFLVHTGCRRLSASLTNGQPCAAEVAAAEKGASIREVVAM